MAENGGKSRVEIQAAIKAQGELVRNLKLQDKTEENTAKVIMMHLHRYRGSTVIRLNKDKMYGPKLTFSTCVWAHGAEAVFVCPSFWVGGQLGTLHISHHFCRTALLTKGVL